MTMPMNSPSNKRPDDPRRQIGFGQPVKARNPALLERVGLGAYRNETGLGAADVAAPFMDGIGADISKIPVIHHTRGGFGPLPDATVQTMFGAQSQILSLNSASAPSGFTGVQTTFPSNGELQTYAMICGIFMHMEPENFAWTLPGNAWSGSNAGSAATPCSPDVFTINGLAGAVVAGAANVCNDLATGQNSLGLAAQTDTFEPALLDWGRWLDYAFWHMALAYNWTWVYGQHENLMNVALRYIGYMPQSGEGVGSMPTETAQYVQRANAYYRASSQANALQFVPQNARRTGSITSGTGQISKFSPDRSYDRVDAIFGGTMLKGLVCGNEKIYRLPAPYIVRPGVSLGMSLNASDTSELNLMQKELSISNGLGLNGVGGNVPPSITADANLSSPTAAGTAGTTFGEQTADSPPILTSCRTVTTRRLYKAGLGFVTIGFTGYELTEAQASQLRDNPQAQELLYLASGCRMLG